MLSPKFILANTDKVRDACRKKGVDEKVVDNFIKFNSQRQKLLEKSQTLRAKRNKLNQSLQTKPDKKTIALGKKIKSDLAGLEQKLQKAELGRKNNWLFIPNVPSEDTPEGKDEQSRVIVRQWGKIPAFEFEPKTHLELGEKHNLIDMERGSKVAGFRGYFLKNEMVLLQQALLQYALTKLLKKGYTPFTAPIICKKEAFINSGHFPWGEEEAYKIAYDGDKEHFLAGTAEVGMVSYHAGEMLSGKDLPLKYAAITPCLRKEAGSYGKDTKGLYRLHEFMKVEQVVFCRADLDESAKMFAELSQNAEEILQDLELPYRVCLMPSGDMGEPQYKKYDIETWMPTRNAYGETMSCSQMLDFQSRRAGIRYKNEGGEKKFVFTLNNTAVASPRLLIAILENNQQKNGSIKIPKVLQSIVGKDKIAKPFFKR